MKKATTEFFIKMLYATEFRRFEPVNFWLAVGSLKDYLLLKHKHIVSVKSLLVSWRGVSRGLILGWLMIECFSV